MERMRFCTLAVALMLSACFPSGASAPGTPAPVATSAPQQDQTPTQADVRTSLTLNQTAQGTGVRLQGKLTTLSGKPVPGAKIDFDSQPAGDKGTVHDYTVTDTVPQGATSADVGLRVNTECACNAGKSADLEVYGFSYAENSAANLVPNASFSNGLAGYGSWGTAANLLKVAPADQGSGQMLHVAVSGQQNLGLNSGTFAVTPAAPFTFTVRSRVAPGSYQSGVFGLFFIGAGNREPIRYTLPFTTPLTRVAGATTDSNGAFDVSVSTAGPASLRAVFPGDAHLWPSNSDGNTDTIP